MKFRLLLLLLTGLALGSCTFSLSEDITPPPGYRSPTPAPTLTLSAPAAPPSPARGAVVYAQNCLACHGERGLGNGPQAAQMPVAVPAIGLAEVASQRAPAEWYRVVTLGRAERGMPSFQSLSEQERWDVLAYVYTLGATAEQLSEAQALFAQNCAECHGVSAPDFRDPAQLADSSGVALRRVIAEGIPNAMPAFGGQLSEAQIQTLILYLRTLAFDLSPLAEPVPSPTPAAEAPAETAEPTAAPVEETGVVIRGRVVHGGGASAPAGLPVTLRIYDASQETGRQMTLTTADGAFLFSGVPPMPDGAYLVTVEYGGVTYVSAAAFYDGLSSEFDLPVTIYESTADFSLLRFQQVHTVLDFSTRGLIRVYEIYIFTNPSNVTVTVETDGASIPFIRIPAEAGSAVTFELTEGSAPLYPATNGFAILPGESLQYGIAARFSLPYERRLEWDHAFLLPVETLDLFVPPGVKVRSDRLSDRGVSSMQGAEYRIYEAASLAAGEPFDLTITGQPGQTGLLGLGEQSGLLIGMAALGTAFLAAGIYLFLRDRARQEEETDEETAEDALGDDPQALMDAIIALDDQYRAGGISENAYRARRRALKERLKDLL